MRHLIIVVTSSILLALAAPGAAQKSDGADPKAASKKAWREGASHYEAGRYPRAIEKFKQSYALAPSPNTLFSLGQAYRKNGNDADALDCFRRYLKDRVDAPNRELVEDLIKDIETRNPQLKLAANAATTVPSPTTEATPSPALPPPAVAPAPEPSSTSVPPAAVDGGATTEPRRWTSDVLGLTLLGGGVVATGVGVGLIVVSGGKSDDASGTVDESEALDQNSSAKTLRTVGVVSTAVGVAAIGAGVVKLFVLPRASRETSVAWSIVPGGVVVAGSF